MSKLTLSQNGANMLSRYLAGNNGLVIESIRFNSFPLDTEYNGEHDEVVTTSIVKSSLLNDLKLAVTFTNTGLTKPIVLRSLYVMAKLGTDSPSLFAYLDMSNNPILLQPGTNVSKTLNLSITVTPSYGNHIDTLNISVSDLKTLVGGLLGTAQYSLVSSLPDNTGNWGWFDGGEIKKSDYPDLWAKVASVVASAESAIVGGLLTYGSTYNGWYKGTTDNYFRKPNLMSGEFFLAPKSMRLSAIISGTCGGNTIEDHTHGASTVASGSHNHTTDSQGAHTHSYYLGGNGENDSINMPSASDAAINYQYYTDASAGAHTHTFTTAAAHTHTITLTASGGTETRPPNIAVKVYGLLRF